MPRPIKTERPVTTEPVVEPIQGTTIVVIHPGSSTLRFGRATDHFPQSVPHLIARKITNGNLFQSDRTSSVKSFANEVNYEKQGQGYRSGKSLINAMRLSGGHRKNKVTSSEVSAYNTKVRPEVLQKFEQSSWTDTLNDTKEFVIGEEVIYLPPDSPYTTRWVMKHGRLNTHAGVDGSLTSIAADIETLWGSAIEQYLDIPVKDLGHYRVVLVLPDTMTRSHTKALIDIMLNGLKFGCVIVHQESVCATFGSGLMASCVVDVGSEKTTVCCVEDGVTVPYTRVTLNYGGDDITRCFFSLLLSVNFPYTDANLHDNLDVHLLNELKETFCHMSLSLPSGHVHEFHVIRPSSEPLLYRLRLGDEPLIAPTAMFVPDLFGISDRNLLETSVENEHDFEDLLDDRYLLEKREVDAKKSRMETESETPETCHVSQNTCVTKQQELLHALRHQGLPLDEAIVYSIEQCSSQETKRKMYGTVLLIGGGLHFKGAADFLLKRLQSRLPAHFQFMKEQMEVISKPKDNDPRCVCWKGGAVLSILDTAQELWVSRLEWNKYGVRILRERCAFQWSVDKQ